MKEKKLKNFEIKGNFIEKKSKKKFSKVVSALNENVAKHRLFCDFGSKHKLKRRQIFIEELKEVK